MRSLLDRILVFLRLRHRPTLADVHPRRAVRFAAGHSLFEAHRRTRG